MNVGKLLKIQVSNRERRLFLHFTMHRQHSLANFRKIFKSKVVACNQTPNLPPATS